ncbi:E3 ubiquitin-protein ligase SGR9, amyloplastic [Brachypodium distachyon]|uniref:RING-type domain-containing protein n=1 Tax=Brachypodium distachyon TaxID=15368 RepID=A0A0Q3K661_BRADI|nr:E3 ubiquitin-protein ligase SGR9, amyloplastic [Brachypodium distachyon]KQK06297.1 hypothetical protein BRADI_2g25560v3 [Brachypodium distachyon]|eukprot:XP_010231378.2 E3 ubiquitin-protein ligase SGR9, amyloplastic [Brachypodium distachyon]
MEASHVHSPAASSSETIMAALLTSVPAAQFPWLAQSIAADARRQRCRLASLLLSPTHFSAALARLRSMPLPAKAALLGRVLLRSLLLLLPALSSAEDGSHFLRLPAPDLDAALLLLAMCNSYSPSADSSPVDWHALLRDDMLRGALSISGLGATPWAAVAPCLDAAAKCRRFADVAASEAGIGIGKDGEGRGAAARAAVLALPAVAGNGTPCAICREEMAPGGVVCGLRPCGHLFHWPCALRWLARRNTCPCCRAELPAEDALTETRRLWRAVERMAAAGRRRQCGLRLCA